MRRLWILLLFCVACGAQERGDERFTALDVYIDAGDETLAAWQFELRSATTKIVGVEGGQAPFDQFPAYDPAALHTEGRIVLAAFTTDKAAPRGRVRVARLHVMETGPNDIEYVARHVVAARPDGTRIEVKVQIRGSAK